MIYINEILKKFNKKAIAVAIIVLILFALQPAFFSYCMDRDIEKEKKIGKTISEDIEKNNELEEDSAQNRLLNEIGQKIALYSGLAGMDYHFKILKREGPNAFSIPGGFIYVTSDLFDNIQSEHELAGILAHEVAHIVHNHALEQVKKNTKYTLLTILGALLTGEPDVAVLGKLTSITFLNQYSREYEEEADLTAIELLIKAGYNPVGFLTYMERQYSREMFSYSIDMGIYQTHPDTANRVKYIKSKLLEKGIEINRRATTNYLKVSSKVILKDALVTGIVSIDDFPIFELTSPSRKEISAKIVEISENMDQFISIDLAQYEITIKAENNSATLFIRNHPVIALNDAEMAYSERTAVETVQEVQDKLKKVLWEFQLNLPFDNEVYLENK